MSKRRRGSNTPHRGDRRSDERSPVAHRSRREVAGWLLAPVVVILLFAFLARAAAPAAAGQGMAAAGLFVAAFALLAIGSTAQRILAFVAGLVAYAVLFYQQEVFTGMWGYHRVAFLLLPDQLIAAWCGGEVGEVHVLDRAAPTGVAMVLWSVGGLLGWLVLDLLGLRRFLSRGETLGFAVGLGLAGISLFTLLVGLAGGLRQPGWFMLLGVLVFAAALWRWVAGRERRERPRSRQAGGSRGEASAGRGAGRHWWWAAVPFSAVILAGAVLPPLDFDVLEYHLQVPKEWYQQGRVTFLPHNVYGNMPLAAEILAAQAMALMPKDPSWWWGALAGKLVLAGYTLLTGLLLYTAGRRFHVPSAGIVAALLYLSTPWVAKIALNGLNESAIAYYLLASFYAGKLWWQGRAEPAAPRSSLLALTGLLAGAAFACKYTSLLLAVAPLLGLVVLGSGGYRVRAIALFLVGVMALSGPWLAKNWVLTGNPTYPLLVPLFGGATRTPEKDLQWRQAHQVPRDAAGNRYSVRQGAEALAEVLGATPWHNPWIVPCLALLVVRGGRNRDVVYWALLLACVLLAWWLVTHRLTRFWVPALPLMALLAGVGASWSAALAWRRTITAVLAVGLIANFAYIVAPGLADNRLLVSLEQLRDDPRLAHGAHRSLAYAYLREHVPPAARVLVVGEAAVFQLRVPAIYNTCFDDCRFEALFRDRSREQRRERLRELKVSHVYIDWSELRRYRQPGNYGYSPYVTRQLVYGELVAEQQLLRPVSVPGLEPESGEIFEVR